MREIKALLITLEELIYIRQQLRVIRFKFNLKITYLLLLDIIILCNSLGNLIWNNWIKGRHFAPISAVIANVIKPENNDQLCFLTPHFHLKSYLRKQISLRTLCELRKLRTIDLTNDYVWPTVQKAQDINDFCWQKCCFFEQRTLSPLLSKVRIRKRFNNIESFRHNRTTTICVDLK